MGDEVSKGEVVGGVGGGCSLDCGSRGDYGVCALGVAAIATVVFYFASFLGAFPCVVTD